MDVDVLVDGMGWTLTWGLSTTQDSLFLLPNRTNSGGCPSLIPPEYGGCSTLLLRESSAGRVVLPRGNNSPFGHARGLCGERHGGGTSKRLRGARLQMLSGRMKAVLCAPTPSGGRSTCH